MGVFMMIDGISGHLIATASHQASIIRRRHHERLSPPRMVVDLFSRAEHQKIVVVAASNFSLNSRSRILLSFAENSELSDHHH